MNAPLGHRGPDDSGVYLDDPVGLAHRRLSIIDLDTGRQPIFNEDGTVVVVFNGEIYNYRELRDSLVEGGHRFTTGADTEVLVHLYEEHGARFVEHLDGMFAFALWDANRERLVLGRDPMGIKPLLVAEDGTEVAFASELPAILEGRTDHGPLDRTAITQYFAFGFVPAPRTAFRNVRKLQPGTLAVVDGDGITYEQFYEPTIVPRDPGIADASARLRRHVESAVEERLMSDVPLGAFLSGGIDSSVVVGTMARLSEEPVRTYTVGFEDALFDESWAAREVADYHGTDHHEFTVSPDEVRSLIPDVLGRLGEPFADQSLLPTYVVSRETRSGVKVALSGDAADELFSGYDRYRGEYLSRYYRAVPPLLRSAVVEPFVRRLPASRESSREEFVRKARKFVRGGDPDVVARHFGWMRIPDVRAAGSFDAVDPVSTGVDSLAQRHEEVTDLMPDGRTDPLDRMQAVDVRYALPNQMLHKVDLSSMYNSLEVRVPFLDTAVVEYAMSLPVEYKITARTRKHVLKRAFEDVLPRSILDRSKQGFDMPVGRWLKNELAGEFRTAVRAVETDAFDTGAVLDVFDEHCSGRGEHGKFLWSVYVFARWAERMRRAGTLERADLQFR